MKKSILGKILVAAMAAVVFGVTAGQARAETIAFCFQDLETEFWVASHEAIILSLLEKNIDVIEKNGNEDANRQLEQVKDAITQGVDGIIIIPQDGESAVTIAKECNDAGVPVGIYNRPPSNRDADAIVVVADNRAIAAAAVEFMAKQAKKLGRKVTPAIIVGDLGDPNAVQRRQGFYDAVEKYPELWTGKPVEIPSKWDANVCRANLESAMQANPDIDFLFTSSDFLFPVIQSVLAPLNKWEVAGQDNHVILGGLDGDKTAYMLMKQGYVDTTGVQDLFAEASMMITAMLGAIEKGEKEPNEWLNDPGFALTLDNIKERGTDMWGGYLYEKENAK